MKTTVHASKKILFAFSIGALAAVSVPRGYADTAEASGRANEMAAKYAARGFYISQAQEGRAGFGVTYQFDIEVNRSVEYVLVLAGDHNAQELELWVESDTGNTIIEDTRRLQNGIAGVKWRSDYNGTAKVVVHFARVVDRCSWSSLVGRRGTIAAPYQETDTSLPDKSRRLEGGVFDTSPASATEKKE